MLLVGSTGHILKHDVVKENITGKPRRAGLYTLFSVFSMERLFGTIVTASITCFGEEMLFEDIEVTHACSIHDFVAAKLLNDLQVLENAEELKKIPGKATKELLQAFKENDFVGGELEIAWGAMKIVIPSAEDCFKAIVTSLKV